MDYKEKYEQALERARNIRFGNPQSATANTVCEEIFPELKESEDERIRKWCISHFRECFRVTKDNVEYQEYLNNKVIPWLERLGEQKPTWSEEDEKILNSIIEDVMPIGECPDYPTDEEREYYYEGDRKVEWLKSIKDKLKGE